ncbi:MAG: TldD/PmbA family protein [Cyanobacteria bacterium J06621_8]
MSDSFAEHKNQLAELIREYRKLVDFLSIRLEQGAETNIFLRNNHIETLSDSVALGGQVRACYRGGWGFAAFDDLTSLRERIEDAVRAARIVGNSETTLAPVKSIETICRVPLAGSDPREIPLATKKALCDRYNEVLRSHSGRITSTAVSYSDSSQRVIIATSEGSLIEQSWSDMEMRFSATARQGNTIQTGRETTGSRQGYEDLTNLEQQVASAAQRAVNALSLPKIKGDIYTVVIDPILTGLFVHEAFGHLSEADMTCENPELLEIMTMGKRFGSPDLQIYDGAAPLPTENNYIHRGSYFYDDEGTPATTTQLIKDGVLVGRLHSRETAAKLGEAPTGNARCLDYHYSPIIRMTNTWIGRGQTPVTNLIKDVAHGVYASNWLGGMTNGEMFTFSAGEAWMIRQGKLAEPVKDVTLSGNVFKTLANIEAIGDDFYWDESGGCGKGGQSGLAVGCGGPSLRIRDVTIGGDSN